MTDHKWKQISKRFDKNNQYLGNVFKCINCGLVKTEKCRSEEIPEIESRVFFKDDFKRKEPIIVKGSGLTNKESSK